MMPFTRRTGRGDMNKCTPAIITSFNGNEKNQELLVALMLFQGACMKDKPYVPTPSDYFNIDKLVSDTGTTWRFDKAVFQFAKIVVSPYQYYLPAYNDSIFTFSNQRIHFQKQSLYGGVYHATDSIAWLLNISQAGKFTVKESNETDYHVEFVLGPLHAP
jgi:hypothetical protein